MIVRVDGDEVKRVGLNRDNTTELGWMDIDVDLSAYAGKEVLVELEGTGVNFWHDVKLSSR